MSSVIGELHFLECGGCLHADESGACGIELQEVVDNLHIEGGNCVCCGCFVEKQGAGSNGHSPAHGSGSTGGEGQRLEASSTLRPLPSERLARKYRA